MLGDFEYYQNMDNARYGNESSSSGGAEKNIKRFLLIVAALVCVLLVWIFAISPCLVPVRADVKGFPGFSGDDVLKYAGITAGAAYIWINAAAAEERLLSHYMVESAKVVKRFPDRLSVFLEPRRPVAVSFAMINGRTQPVYFDRNGVAIRAGRGAGEMPSVFLPVVSGVLDGIGDLRLGTRLPADILPVFAGIGTLNDENPKIWLAVSEIAVEKKEGGLYDLMLYPIGNSIRLRMDSNLSKENVNYALLLFDVCRQLGEELPEEIDVRSGLGVYKAKGARFGE